MILDAGTLLTVRLSIQKVTGNTTVDITYWQYDHDDHYHSGYNDFWLQENLVIIRLSIVV